MTRYQHPAIAQIEKTGTVDAIYKSNPPVCSVCHEEIYSGEYYGTCGDKVICNNCMLDELHELNASEKLVALGYDPHLCE